MKKSSSDKVIDGIGYFYITIVSVLCLIPFWLIISASFSDEDSLLVKGYGFFPKQFSLDAYYAIFVFPKNIIRAYGVTIFVTVVGTIIGLFIITMAGYVLQRKDYKYRNKIAFFFYFTSIFSGGLIPWYIINVKYLHLKDNLLVLILPFMLNPFNIILMKNFMKSIPEAITESAKIDGAGDFKIYTRLILPLAKPGLATIGLFLALMYWNDWFLSSLYITDIKKYPLQLILYNILSKATALTQGMSQNVNVNVSVPTETVKMATAVIATGPIILLYPFVQKYFIKGLTIGAVKG